MFQPYFKNTTKKKYPLQYGQLGQESGTFVRQQFEIHGQEIAY